MIDHLFSLASTIVKQVSRAAYIDMVQNYFADFWLKPIFCKQKLLHLSVGNAYYPKEMENSISGKSFLQKEVHYSKPSYFQCAFSKTRVRENRRLTLGCHIQFLVTVLPDYWLWHEYFSDQEC